MMGLKNGIKMGYAIEKMDQPECILIEVNIGIKMENVIEKMDLLSTILMDIKSGG